MDTDAFIDPGRLVFLKRLGEGAFAEVQLAELRPAEGSSGASGGGAAAGARQVAVKTLRQELLADPAQIELFVREVELLRKLRNRCDSCPHGRLRLRGRRGARVVGCRRPRLPAGASGARGPRTCRACCRRSWYA